MCKAVEKSVGGKPWYTESQMNWLVRKGFAVVDPGPPGAEETGREWMRPIYFRGAEYFWVPPHVKRTEFGEYVDVPGRFER